MASSRENSGFFETPHVAVYALMTVTVLLSGFCFIQTGGPSASSDLLFRYGGMYSTALARHDYWRLVAYGFLHVNFVHLTTNMLCLVLWGAHLERRVGAAYFIFIYLASMGLGAIIGDALHHSPYLTVGASGATSGLLGALLCLYILGKLDVRFDFFVINIGLNVAFAISNSGINWQIHLGGFAVGLIACALLDLAEKLNGKWLRCKFPEFVKVNLLLLALAAALLILTSLAPAIADGTTLAIAAIALAAALCAIIKLTDLALSIRKGLAFTVIALAAANAAGVMVGGWLLASSSCIMRRPSGVAPIDNFASAFCATPLLVTALVAIGAVAATLLACSNDIRRGLQDVGFVATSLRAERGRRHGL
jgi:rhomboid protease GluP